MALVMNHRDAEDAEEGLKRRFLRSERSAQSASTGNPTAAWSKTIGVLCVLCVSVVQTTWPIALYLFIIRLPGSYQPPASGGLFGVVWYCLQRRLF